MRRVFLCCVLAACGSKTPTPTTAKADDHSFVLEVGGQLSSAGKTAALVEAKEIHKGDGLFLTVATTKKTKLYVAYCDSQQHLSIYPPTGNLVGEPGGITRIPQSGEFETDEHTGLEHIFVIATAADLDRSDPSLFSLLQRAQGASDTHCSTELAKTTEQSRAAKPAAATSAPPPTPEVSAPLSRGVETDVGSDKVVQDDDDDARLSTEPGVWRPRGLKVVESKADTSSSTSDSSGIAIWAITLAHK